VKHKATGIFVLSSESNRVKMHRLGVSALRTGKPITFEEVLGRIEAVTNEDIQRVAEEMFDENKIAITALGVSSSEAEELDSLIK